MLQVVLGVLYVIVGANIVADPLAGAIALTLVLGIALVVSGIIRLVICADGADRAHGWLVVAAIISLVLGVWLITGIPYSGVAIGLFVGIELLMAGIIWIVVAWSRTVAGGHDRGKPRLISYGAPGRSCRAHHSTCVERRGRSHGHVPGGDLELVAGVQQRH